MRTRWFRDSKGQPRSPQPIAAREPQGSEPESDAEEVDQVPPSPNVVGSVLRPTRAGQDRYAGLDRDSGLGAPSTAPALSTDEQVVASRVFKPFINKGTPSTRDETRQQLQQNSFFPHCLRDVDNVRKIQEFVRYKADCVRHKNLILGNEGDDNETYTRSESSVRRQWEDNDSKVIEQRFSFIGHLPPMRKQIIETFQQDPVLRYILEDEGEQRCYEKVKNLLKKIKQRP